MSRTPSRAVASLPTPSQRQIRRRIEELAEALRAERFPLLARSAEALAIQAGREGRDALVRPAARLLIAAEQRDAAASVAALVRLAEAVDRTLSRAA